MKFFKKILKLFKYILILIVVVIIGFIALVVWDKTDTSISAAKPVLLECKKVRVITNLFGDHKSEIDPVWFQYYYLDLKNKNFHAKGWGKKVKGTCSLGTCEEYGEWKNRELPYKEENAAYLYLGKEWKANNREVFDFHTFNKSDLSLVHYDNMLSWTDGRVIESQKFFECEEISKFPF